MKTSLPGWMHAIANTAAKPFYFVTRAVAKPVAAVEAPVENFSTGFGSQVKKGAAQIEGAVKDVKEKL
jgi:hypothetical protein